MALANTRKATTLQMWSNDIVSYCKRKNTTILVSYIYTMVIDTNH